MPEPGVISPDDALKRENDALRAELAHLREALAEAEALADRDALVGVLNRRAFMREMARVMSYTERYGGGAAVAFFDLDGFKPVNDTHGHAAGDAVLRHVGRVLEAHTRDSDVIGRLGGDEFGVILVHVCSDDADRKAAALAQALRDTPLMFGGTSIAISAAHGVRHFSGAEDPELALARADEAMYAAKRGARSARMAAQPAMAAS